MDIFTSDEDRIAYLELMAEESARSDVTFLAWCLMDLLEPSAKPTVATPG